MRDSRQRTIDYARISITDRCNLRCVYCMPAHGVPKRSHGEILSYEQIVRICTAFTELGIRTLKITGGEPLVRRGVETLAARLKALPGIDAVTLTTNGILLPQYARPLREAGVDGINISLDALEPDLYARITRGGDVHAALRGLDAALDAGFPAVKVNCVPFSGRDDAGLLAVAELARERPVHVRFIEMMPIGMGAEFIPLNRESLRSILQDAYGPMLAVDGPPGHGPARYYSFSGFTGTIGFIQTLDHEICGRCNRIRLTADGILKACLHMDTGVSLREALEAGMPALRSAVARAITKKPEHHLFTSGPVPGAEHRPMSQIGG